MIENVRTQSGTYCYLYYNKKTEVPGPCIAQGLNSYNLLFNLSCCGVHAFQRLTTPACKCTIHAALDLEVGTYYFTAPGAYATLYTGSATAYTHYLDWLHEFRTTGRSG